MPKYEYHGRDSQRRPVGGVVESPNESLVALELVRNGIVPISITLVTQQKSPFVKILNFLTKKKPTAKDMTFLSRQFFTLIKAGVPMVRSVKVVADSSKNIRLKEALMHILEVMENGQSLTVGMRQHPDIFSPLMASLIGVGEATGVLDETFKQLSVHFERDEKTSKQIKSALRYPLIVIIFIGIAVSVVNVFVIPSFKKFFTGFKVDLPLPTKILISSSNFFTNYWYILILILISIIVAFIKITHSKKGRPYWDKIKLAIPLIGPIMQLALLARFCRSFALSSRTGVPLLDSIGLIAKTTDNAYISQGIVSMADFIKRGESITSAATKAGMFTSLILQMLAVGEETGELDKLLDQIADSYESEVDFAVERLGDAIEPILLIFVASLVLLLALGIFLPMWDLWKVAGHH